MFTQRHTPVIVIGLGHVGKALLSQVLQTRPALTDRYGLSLLPVAVADRSGALFEPGGLSADRIEAVIANKTAGLALDKQPGAQPGMSPLELVQQAAAQGLERALVVDVSAAEGMGPVLRSALEHNYGVVLANKRPLAGTWAETQTLFNDPRVRFEATVGAGLPIIKTLREMMDTGDVIKRIEGALSGTLGYLCSALEDGRSFSQALKTAREGGFTELDPREDLSGVDVARKVLILGRLVGWPLELDDLKVEPMYRAADTASMSVEEFMAELPKLDAHFAAYMGGVAGVLRYMADINAGGGLVALRMVGERLAVQLRDTLNQVSIWTERYADKPLSIIGYGGGKDGAAAAVLADCLHLAQVMPVA